MTQYRGLSAAAVPPWGLAIVAMLSIQLGSALSVQLVFQVGPAGFAWLRLTAGALILLTLARPPLRTVRRRDIPVLVGLGVTTGLVTITFLAAIERIPLGTAVAVEFLGPLSVAAVRSHNKRALAWPALALIGVVLLTEPWKGDINLAGLGFAGLAAIGWAGYILLTQRVGDRFAGIGGLSLTVPIAAATAAVAGIPQATGQLTLGIVAAAVGLALLHPVLPFAFEMFALRRMTHTAFGTLMAIEPAIGVLLGLLVLTRRHRSSRSWASCSSSSPATPHNAVADAVQKPPNAPAPTPDSTSSASAHSTGCSVTPSSPPRSDPQRSEDARSGSAARSAALI